MEIKQKIMITFATGIILAFGFYLITNIITKYTGFSVSAIEEDDFMNCLKEQEITLYINTEDVTGTLQNIRLKDYLQYIKVKNCLRSNSKCLEEGVTSYPSWSINNKLITEDIDVGQLKELSRCRL